MARADVSHKWFHCDDMAGQNIAKVAKSQLNEFCGPEYLLLNIQLLLVCWTKASW